jgi:hypothetical protein
MRRQNPPQSYIDKAKEIEKYLAHGTLAFIYAIAGVSYIGISSLIFAALVYGSEVNITKMSVMVFALLAFIPATFVFLAYFLRPNDPLSRYITKLANSCRRPFAVPPHECTFRVQLLDGESLSMRLAFRYPLKDQTLEVKERLYTIVHGALAQEFRSRSAGSTPTDKEIQSVLDTQLTLLAEERGIPVLYLEILDVCSSRKDTPAQVEYLSTGTWS